MPTGPEEFQDRTSGMTLQFEDHLATMHPDMFADNVLSGLAAILNQAALKQSDKGLFIVGLDQESQPRIEAVPKDEPIDSRNAAVIMWSQQKRGTHQMRYVHVFTAMENPDGERTYFRLIAEPLTSSRFRFLLIREFSMDDIISPDLRNAIQTLEPMRPDRSGANS